MAALVKVLATVFVVSVVFLGGADVSAETHHVVGGGESLNLGSWLSGRIFRVGDKIWFNLGNEDKIVELKGPDELKTCDISNPIKMYTDHVVLEKQGTRYFASANLENCKNGLRIPVSVEPEPDSEFEPSEHFDPPSEFDPPGKYEPVTPEPYEPEPEPEPKPEPRPEPKPEPRPSYPPPSPPSGYSVAVNLNGLSSTLFAGFALYYFGFGL